VHYNIFKWISEAKLEKLCIFCAILLKKGRGQGGEVKFYELKERAKASALEVILEFPTIYISLIPFSGSILISKTGTIDRERLSG
jgi:hypothetical protein